MHVKKFLAICNEKKVPLCRGKLKFEKHEVVFAGYSLSQDGYDVDKTLLKAVSEFLVPSNITDLRSFFGLANRLSVNMKKVSKGLQPLRPLLGSKTNFLGVLIKLKLSKQRKRSYPRFLPWHFCDAARLTRIITEACNTRLKFVVRQKNGDTWYTIQTDSCFLSDAESR